MLSRSLCSLARRASSGQKITSIRNITVNKRGFASEPSGKQTNEPSKLSTKPSQTSTPPVAPPSASSAPPSANSGKGPFIAIAAAGALAVGVYALRKQLGIEGPVDAVVSTLTGKKPSPPAPTLEEIPVRPPPVPSPPSPPPPPPPAAVVVPEPAVVKKEEEASPPPPSPPSSPSPPSPSPFELTPDQASELAVAVQRLIDLEAAAAAAAVKEAVTTAVETVSATPSPPQPTVDIPSTPASPPAKKKEKEPRDAVLSSTKDSVQAQVAGELARALKADLEIKHSASALNSLSVEELREKVLALQSELSDRGKYEALRLNEFLIRSEEQWKAKFAEFTEFQHEALKAEAKRVASEIEETTKKANTQWRAKELQRLHAELQKEAQKSLDEFIVQFKNDEAAGTEERIKILASFRGRVDGVNNILKDRLEYEAASARVHKIALATIALAEAVDARIPVTDAAAALRVAGAGDALIETVVDSLPHELHRAGVPSRKEIYDRFDVTIKEGRRAALVPANSGVIGQALGTISSALFLPTSTTGDSAGTGPVSEVQASMAVFDDAEVAMRDGNLKSAVRSLSRLQGYPANAVSGWVSIAAQRVAIDQALKAVRSHTSTLIASMY